jgi:hypothetical protein
MTDSLVTDPPTISSEAGRVAEQTTTSRFWLGPSTSPTVVRLTMRLSIPGEEGVDVDTGFGPGVQVDAELLDLLAPRVFEGVHSGIGRLRAPLPPEGLRVLVTELIVEPPPSLPLGKLEAKRIGDTIETLVDSAVGGLLAGLRELALR